MDLALVGALAAFFRVDTVALCFFSGDGDGRYPSWISNSSALDPFFTVQVSDHQILKEKLLVQESRLLMACDDPIFLDLSSELFGPNIVWLLPESEIINSDLLPLTLRSTLLTFSTTNKSDEVKITETFAINTVKSSVVKNIFFGTWDLQSGLDVPQPLLWERRSDLTGVTLVDSVNFVDKISFYMSDNETLTGMMPELLGLLQDELHFRLERGKMN